MAKEIIDMFRYECVNCGSLNEINNIKIHEWVGFNFNKYLSSIESFIKNYEYKDLRGNNDIELEAGYLTDKQLSKLKDSLIRGSFNLDNCLSVK